MKFAIYIALTALSCGAGASEVPVEQCPATLGVRQDMTDSVPKGWSSYDSDMRHPLGTIYISTMETHSPVRTGSLIASHHIKTASGGEILYYDYLRLPNEHHEHWTICTYRDTLTILSRRLPENVYRCEVNGPVIRCFDTPRKSGKKRK
ncbi:MAG: hypothetical protein LBK55_10905 [Azoarcus sp.]|jgi:hypothetical protein|nr:hypothetical protein [Azoarcus sp.]